jgi:carbamoyl-phosphate synthase large subunit
MRLLFTGGGGAGNEALLRLLADRYTVHFADADMSRIDPGLPADRRHAIPLANDIAFAARLSDLCRRLSIGVLIPGVDEELPYMDEVAARTPGLRILVPEPAFVAIMRDKLVSMQELARGGIAVPRTSTAAEPAPGFPCLAKPRRGRGSRGVQVLESEHDLEAYRQLSRLAPDAIILQELLVGQEYTVMMAADSNGILCAVVPVRVALKKGITLSAETQKSADVETACRAMHAAVPTRGCYNVQLIRTAEGRVLPFEINPRVSTTLCLGIAAGVDPIAVFLGEARHGDVSFRAGVRLQRHWRNHINEVAT